MTSASSRSPFVGAILAAGRGTRMFPFSDRYPKPLLPICNKPLIQYQIELMRSMGIDDIIVLIGHKGFEIAKVLGDGRGLGVNLRYVEQTQMLGIAHAVGRLEPHVDRPFMLFLGDIFFIPADLPAMFRIFDEQAGGAVLAVKEDDPEAIRRNFSVTLSNDGYVTRVIEKPRHSPTRLKGVGLYLFDLTIFDAVRRTPRTAVRDEYEITDAIQVMIDDGHPVRVAHSILDDVNLTTPADVLAINLRQVPSMVPAELIGDNCVLDPGVRIENSVIGSDVTVTEPISIQNSVIFSGTHVRSRLPISDSLVTSDSIINCNLPFTP